MFKLDKDIEKYKGVPPYASELYGIYQPLLGWQSNLTKKWVQRGGGLVDPRIKRILDANIIPGPTSFNDSNTWERLLTIPLQPGSGRYPRILLAKDLNSELLKLIQRRVQAFADVSGSRLPNGDEWESFIDINNLMDEEQGDLRIVHDIHKEQIAKLKPGDEDFLRGYGRTMLLERMQYESQIAAFLLFYVSRNPGDNPNELKKLFKIETRPSVSEIFRSTDPLANIDPNDKSGALSPVGFVHLFRQYFFDLGTFLGEPVEHIWLSPGTTIELIEVSTRKILTERTFEEMTESIRRSERNETLKDELSDAVKVENENSTKLGVSQSNTVNLYVYQGTASTNYGVESTRKDSRETTHKQNREQSEKLSSEIKQSFKSVFRTVIETTDVRSRRHVIQNTSDKLINYELRRKMRRVGVQVQDIGTRLCWQVFVDDPGVQLGLAELVHFAESPELNNLKEPEKIPIPTKISKKMTVPIPFLPILNYTNNRANYEYKGIDPPGQRYEGKHLSIIRGNNDDDDSQTIFGPFQFTVDPPQTGYTLTQDIRLLSVQGNKIAAIRDKKLIDAATGKFEIVMQQVNYGGADVINLEMELIFEPSPEEFKRVAVANAAAATKYNEEKQRLGKKSFMETVRQRIKDASNIKSRPSWDLREEERTVIYRELIGRLMLDSWKITNDDTQKRLAHVRSEIIRSIFDVDSMLYFVAPEWWMPRRRQGQLNLNANVEGLNFALTDNDIVKWGGEIRPDNYKITENSPPARLGSSLGWLLQLDGDNLRNAFLNSPWVKAVIPIRPGREKAALNWLKAMEGHEDDAWDTPYLGNDDPEFQGKTIGEVLEIIADRLEQQNGDIQNVLEADKVFEYGFDPLANGFDAGLSANQVFSQWISILPTDQLVAVEYEPKDLMNP
jgi:hypothetical protein